MEPLFARKFFVPQIKGRIASYVARNTEPLGKLVKYIKTMCERYAITSDDMQQILAEIKSESIEPFLDPSKGNLYQPERLVRFEKLCQELRIEVKK